MLKTIRTATCVLALGLGPAMAMENPMVGGAPMFADRNIVENAVNSADHTTLVPVVLGHWAWCSPEYYIYFLIPICIPHVDSIVSVYGPSYAS